MLNAFKNEAKKRGEPPIFLAILLEDFDTAFELINEEGAKLNKKSVEETPLHLAIRKGYTDIIEELIEKGANLNLKYNGTSPVTLALRYGRTDIACLLIENGANPNVRGLPPEPTLLHWAIINDQVNFATVLIDNGADLNSHRLHESPAKYYLICNLKLACDIIENAYSKKKLFAVDALMQFDEIASCYYFPIEGKILQNSVHNRQVKHEIDRIFTLEQALPCRAASIIIAKQSPFLKNYTEGFINLQLETRWRSHKEYQHKVENEECAPEVKRSRRTKSPS